MAVFDITKPGVWNGVSGFWTFVPNEAGKELVSGPPKAVGEMFIEGPEYNCPADGVVYKTWAVPPPRHLDDRDIRHWQQIVRWDSPLTEAV